MSSSQYCRECGNQVNDAKFCSKCGNGNKKKESDSKWWYFVSAIFSIIGGIIIYFILRKDSPKMARNCLIIGFITFIITFLIAFGL